MKRFVFIVLMFCGAGVAHGETPVVPILLYHHIQEIPADASESLRRWTITPQQFADQLKWIKEQGFSVVTMSQYSDMLKRHARIGPKLLILNFDDGWKDHYTVVFPILKDYGYAATFFVTTDSVGHSAFMTWENLQEMEAAQMDIQSHSVTHPHLNRLRDEDAYREISQSKTTLGDHLQQKQVVFAYPFGAYTDRIIMMVKDAGYESAAIVNGSNIGYLYRADRTYTLGRIAVEGDMTLDDIARNIRNVNDHKKNSSYHPRGVHQSFGCMDECR